jgi:hypothetical protein
MIVHVFIDTFLYTFQYYRQLSRYRYSTHFQFTVANAL